MWLKRWWWQTALISPTLFFSTQEEDALSALLWGDKNPQIWRKKGIYSVFVLLHNVAGCWWWWKEAWRQVLTVSFGFPAASNLWSPRSVFNIFLWRVTKTFSTRTVTFVTRFLSTSHSGLKRMEALCLLFTLLPEILLKGSTWDTC